VPCLPLLSFEVVTFERLRWLLSVLQASVTGNLTVSFYDAEAGWGALGPVELLARTNPQVRSAHSRFAWQSVQQQPTP
jgi:hypothetical protein